MYVERSKVKATGNENVKSRFSAYVRQKSMIYVKPRSQRFNNKIITLL